MRGKTLFLFAGADLKEREGRLSSGCQGELAEANGNLTLVHHWKSYNYKKLTTTLLLWSLLLRNCGQIPAKETGADIGCTLIGIVFNWPLNYNCPPKQSQLKKKSGNETVEGDVGFHARQILIKIEGRRERNWIALLVKAVVISM